MSGILHKLRDDAENNSTSAIDNQAPASPESENLVQLVWKYFEDVIRQTLIEVEESLSSEKINSQEDVG